jgi:transcriptional regulator with XRE-family HTH domain
VNDWLRPIASATPRALGISAATLRLWSVRGCFSQIAHRAGTDGTPRRTLRCSGGSNSSGRVRRLNPGAIAQMLPGPSGPRPRSGATTTDRAPQVGDRLRAERRRSGLTLREAAAKAGISISFLSAAEHGISRVSISTLHTLVKLYGVTVQGLLAESRTSGRLVRASERPTLAAPGSGVRIEQLALGRLQMEPHFYRVDPGAGSEGAYDHIGEEFIFVLHGKLEVWLEEREHHALGAGDCLYFPSTLPHRWHNPGPGPAELLWVNTPATF